MKFVRAWIAVTDQDWYSLLSRQESLEEVNFWQPSGQREFKVIKPGELFLFKLHAPHNFIVGGGLLGHASILPVSLAWETFGIKNGATSLEEMKKRIGKYRKDRLESRVDYRIGCILVQQPFFLKREEWIPAPRNWAPNIVQGKCYDVEGREIREVMEALGRTAPRYLELTPHEESKFGGPTVIHPRLGQGTFRILVVDSYGRRCSVTGERTLPALDAAHIKPYKRGGDHRIDNGLLLRSDIHRLFDLGYVSVTPDLKFRVSRRIREEFENGRDYYALNERAIQIPREEPKRPSAEFLAWHNDSVFLG